MKNDLKKLIIIDGNALIHRSFHAIPATLRTKDGTLVNAVYGFCSFLIKSITELKPDYVVLTLDKSGPTFRHLSYPEYKATRTKAPDELYEQIPLIKDVAKAFDIPIFELSGYEADDLIGTISSLEELRDIEKVIITGDLDTLQLVEENTKVYTMSRGLSDSVLYDNEKVIERYGFGSEAIVDYKALRGDPSDNIPGVKGIGEKTATDLIIKYKTLDKIYEAIDKTNLNAKERTVQLLKDGRNSAYISKELATINKEAPIDFDLKKTVFEIDNEKVFNFLSKLEFKSLISKTKELKQAHNHKSSQAETKTDNKYQVVDSQFEELITIINRVKNISLKPVVTSNKHLVGLVILCDKKNYYLDEKNITKIKTVLENPDIRKTGHNLKETYRLLKLKEINTEGLYFDTMIASYLLNPSSRNHDLETIIFNEYGIDLKSKSNEDEKIQMSLDFENKNIEEIIKSSTLEIIYLTKLAKKLEKELEQEALIKVFEEIEMPLIAILAEMEQRGILFNVKPIAKLEKELEIRISKLEDKIHELAKEVFNVNSTKQLKEILFEKLKISSSGIKKGKTGFSTADDELAKLMDKHPIIPFLREHRETSKLLNTYVCPLPELINKETGRIHSHFNQTVTATGRLSSTDPNLQNIPARSEEGKTIRKAFVADKGCLLLGLDYSQIELRLAAHLSKDSKLLEAFKNREDIHLSTAAAINEVKISEVTKKMRQEAKATNFGIIYGQGPHGLSQAAGITYQQAKLFIDKYFLNYPGVKKMMNKSIKDAQNNGYTITLTGRKRPLPEINSSMPFIKKAAERMAINAPIQGGAADIIKMAMIEIHKQIKADPDISMLIQVHDELIFEVKAEKASEYMKKIKEIMENVIKLKVPLEVEGGQASNWGDIK